MGSLNGIFGSITHSMASFSEALEVIQSNIANAATPGYARQRPVVSPLVAPNGLESFGVDLRNVQSLRDRLLDFQVLQAGQSKSFFEKKSQILEQAEQFFRLSGDGSIGASIDQFFGAASALAVSPLDFTLRRSVLASADSLTRALRSTYSGLSDQRFQLDSQAFTVVTRVNSLLSRVAELAKVRAPPDSPRPNASVETNLNQALDELAKLIDFSLIHQSDGTLTVVSGSGVPLVAGSTARPLTVAISQQQIRVIDAAGRDVTTGVQSEKGALSALLETRNVTLPSFLADLNRLAKSVVDRVNEQLAAGVDLNGVAGKPLFQYAETSVTGAGRSAGLNGASTPAPPDSITVTFSNGLNGVITASLDSYFVAAAPPSLPVAGDNISVTFTSADGSIQRTITTSPLLGGESAAAIAARLNDQIALDPDLAGRIAFSDPGNGQLKIVLSGTAGQGFSFASTTNNTGFTTGLEPGGVLGGQSAAEIAAALNTQVALDPALAAAGVRFAAIGGEVKLDADVTFDFAVAETPGATTDAFGAPDVTGFASGLPAAGAAGGANAAFTLSLANLSLAEIATGTAANPDGNENVAALAALAGEPLLGGVNFTDFYAQLVTRVGNESTTAASQFQTREQLLLTTQNMRDSLSGVDMNEEAARLLQFEQAYQAMLRVVQVIDGLMNEILNIIR